ncbi:hypothetical protein GJ496_006940 [Pomphorhynchus laevis]|nr:hypothetical protein GJ496_006940 [Pomphorhynchus laevis]
MLNGNDEMISVKQPARVLLLECYESAQGLALIDLVCHNLRDFISLISSHGCSQRIPLFAFIVVGKFHEVVCTLLPITEHVRSLTHCLDRIYSLTSMRSGNSDFLSSDSKGFATIHAFRSTFTQFNSNQDALSYGLDISLFTLRNPNAIVENIQNILKFDDSQTLTVYQFLRSGYEHSNSVTHKSSNVKYVSQDSITILKIFKSWLHLDVMIDRLTLYVEGQAFAVKCDVDEVMLPIMNSSSADRYLIRSDQCRIFPSTNALTNRIYRYSLCIKRWLMSSGLCQMNIFGQSVILYPSTSCTMPWDEIQSNKQSMLALIEYMKLKVSRNRIFKNILKMLIMKHIILH